MTFLIIYLIGCLITAVLSVYLAVGKGELLLKELVLFILATLTSWVGVFIFVIAYIEDNGDEVVWRRKEDEE